VVPLCVLMAWAGKCFTFICCNHHMNNGHFLSYCGKPNAATLLGHKEILNCLLLVQYIKLLSAIGRIWGSGISL
jgi:hypothetical protein